MKNILLTLFVTTLFALGSTTWTACSDDDGGDNNNNNQQDAGPDAAEDEFAEVTILHTSDVHSHASGYGPYLDYTPDNTADNDTVMGGYSRLATAIGTIRAEQDTANVPVLLLDSGDFTMGTLYDISNITAPIAFTFLQMMEYDAVTLGNHEFDWSPVMTALMISNARTAGFGVPILASNMITSDATPGDEELAALVNSGVIADKLVITLDNGMVVGLLGLLGADAEAKAGGSSPVTWEHAYSEIQLMVDDLVDNDGVDMVVVLSHGGVNDDETTGEDVDLATNVDGIHVIASGHAHTETTAPILENGAYIFEPGGYGTHLARLDVNFNLTQGTVEDVTYTLIPVDDTIQGDTAVQGMVDQVLAGVDAQLLAGLGVVAATPVVELPFDMVRVDWSEHPLGNMCADSLRNIATAAVLSTGGATPDAIYHMAVVPEGVIRDGMYQGSTWIASFMDVYNVLPLGISPDPTQTALGYPLVTAYLTPAEIKTVAEVAVSLAEVIGWSSAWLHFAGVRFDYDPNGTFMDKVSAARLCGNAIPTAYGGDEDYFSMVCTTTLNLADTTTLYRVVVDMYALLMLGVVADYGVVLVPKKSDGTPIDVTDTADILSMRIDADPAVGGIQELKPWMALWMFLSTLPDMDSSGLPEVPNAIYNATTGLGMGRLNAQ
jgi:5'-nucleotidase